MAVAAPQLARAVHVWLEPEQYDELAAAARKGRTGMATIVRQALDAYLHPPQPDEPLEQ